MSKLSRVITRRTVGAYEQGSVSNAMRARRWRQLRATFPDIDQMNVLDVGGDSRSWQTAGIKPAHVWLLNVSQQEASEPWMSVIVGDACNLPANLPTVDLVYSNSVIEHVGGHWRRQRFAEGIVNAAPRYWVQTPYRYFPMEPHFLIPGLQHLSRAAQTRVITRWPVGNYASVEDRQVALRATMGIELLSKTELKAYFPTATIRSERLFGLVKSLIAVRT